MCGNSIILRKLPEVTSSVDGNYSHIGAVVGCTACVWGGSFLGQVEMSSVRTEGHCKNQ